MAFQPGFGKPMVSEEFNAMCTEHRVEARVSGMPNPGDPMTAVRLITFTNYNNLESVTITEQNAKQTQHIVGPRGTLQIMVNPGDKLPLVAKGTANQNA